MTRCVRSAAVLAIATLEASIQSTPAGVAVVVNGERVGTTPMKYGFTFAEEHTRYTVTGAKEGYHAHGVVVTNRSLTDRSGVIHLVLEPQDKSVLITSVPSQALVRIGGEEVGQTPLEYSFDFSDRRSRYPYTISKAGYFERTGLVTTDSAGVRSGTIHATLEADPVWKVTVESEAANKWLRIQVDPAIELVTAWQKIIDSLTTVYDTLEQLDQSSGYIRSAPRIREFPKGPDGPFTVRTQFLGSLSSKNPLVYKIKLLSTTRTKGDPSHSWEPFDRVFSLDAQLVEELQNRLGLK